MELLFVDKYEIFIKQFDHFNKPHSAKAHFSGINNSLILAG